MEPDFQCLPIADHQPKFPAASAQILQSKPIVNTNITSSVGGITAPPVLTNSSSSVKIVKIPIQQKSKRAINDQKSTESSDGSDQAQTLSTPSQTHLTNECPANNPKNCRLIYQSEFHSIVQEVNM